MNKRRLKAGGDRGFVLVGVIWVLAALALLASYIDGVVTADIERVRLAKRALQQELDARSTEATLLYLLATGRTNHQGLILEAEQRFLEPGGEPLRGSGDGVLTVTGQVYQGLGEIRFSIQDENGFASVNAPRNPLLAAVLEYVGVGTDQIVQIKALVGDYIDIDDELELGGAERVEDRGGRLPLPANWLMVTPLELRRVPGVRELIDATQWRRLRPLLTTCLPYGYNFNTMRPEVVAALLGVTESRLEGLLKARAERPLARLDEVAELTGVRADVDPTMVLAYPSPNLRIAIWSTGGGVRSVVGIMLTPRSNAAPWRKEYWYSEPVDADSETVLGAATPLLQAS